MGRLNTVTMVGRVEKKPMVKIKKEPGEPDKYEVATIYLLTARRSMRNDKGNLAGLVRTDVQIVKTRNQYLIEDHIVKQKLEVGDLILVSGTLSTMDKQEKAVCPHCGEKNEQYFTVSVYIDAKSILKIRSIREMESQDILQLLAKYADISNNAQFFATLVREPRYAPDFGVARRELSMHVAMNRKRRIEEDGPDKRTDYPHVRAFGKQAEDGSKVLHIGSEIYIEGAIETRDHRVSRICPFCEEKYEVEKKAVEIVPYSIEYTENVDVTPLRQEDEEGEEYGRHVSSLKKKEFYEDDEDDYGKHKESSEEDDENEDYEYEEESISEDELDEQLRQIQASLDKDDYLSEDDGDDEDYKDEDFE